ncbi:MFS transporter [Chitinophaga pinensis]|uniref:Major facilitator superfamily MFS_1 n=1 Tax=Chitinophaga pinensis (strain ATCC 43595 / DSM 2588 / LMG 13176 / NBRC 15968 / NCIMB 11800 / UQM 2034) TaxID=485918 RepID=A0A979GRZ0_CHIPD|nr:MFS transporter [Chitinophaga pinensis]ACU58806.1 major facilitator superfamily MFS_1 [Chitinophaga pinensis DSM 2588]
MKENISDPRRWLALIVLLTGTLLPPLDFFIVNVALPAIRTDLHASQADSQLVVSVYAAAYAVTLILGGRLGDIYGRKRVLISGMLGFGLASAICGLAPSPAVLIAGRLLQGVTAAIMGPQSLASIHAIFPSDEKNRALSLYGATFGLASVCGQLLGGVLVSADLFGMGWRSVFLINLPVIVLAIPAALLLLHENRAERSDKLDIPGALLLAAGLLSFVFPLIEGRENHWPWWCVVLLILSLPLLFLFWQYEKKKESTGHSPLVYTSLLMSPGLRRSLAAAFFFYALASFFLIFAVYEQGALAHDTLATGLAILPLGIGFFLGPWCSPSVAKWLGSRTAAFGMILEVVGLMLAAVLAVADHPSWLPVPLFIIGLGQGMAIPALVRLNVDQVDARFSGLAAGLVSATLQISAAVFVALVGGLFFTLAPEGASAEEIQLSFAISTSAIGVSLGLAAILCWKR